MSITLGETEAIGKGLIKTDDGIKKYRLQLFVQEQADGRWLKHLT